MTTRNLLFFFVFLTAIFTLSCKEDSESSIVKITAKRGTITLTSTGVFVNTALGPRVLLNNHSSYSMISFEVKHGGKVYKATLDQSWPCSDLAALTVPGLNIKPMELDTINPGQPLLVPSHNITANFLQFGAAWFSVKPDGTADSSMDTIEEGEYEDFSEEMRKRFPYKSCFVGMAGTSFIGLGQTYSGTPIMQDGKIIGLYSGSNYETGEYSLVSLIPYGLFVGDQ